MTILVSPAWPHDAALRTNRLDLLPVRVEHAEPMTSVLADSRLYEIIGGAPPTTAQLRNRYQRWQKPTSDDDTEGWLNWIVFQRRDDAAVGTVQATTTPTPNGSCAELAWIIGTSFQRRGFAAEATTAVVDWLGRHHTNHIRAHIAPGHTASERIAHHLGMEPTEHLLGGERRWEFPNHAN